MQFCWCINVKKISLHVVNLIIAAVWMIIKGWLDADQSKHTYFCKRKDIEKYIEKDQLLPHMIKEEKSKK
jgi:hypothetical protein